MIRLGGPLFGKWNSPEEWADAVTALGYRSAYCPVGADADDDVVEAYARVARARDIVIAEVGAWSNPISPQPAERAAALNKCKAALQLAERIGANCCVNVAGARGERWDGPHPDNLTEETFSLIVDTVREIIDDVRPTRTFYTLETMPWMYPDSVAGYLELIRAIDRPAFAAHFDPVNIICSPQIYFRNGDLLREGIRTLGPWLKACHAKDIVLRNTLTVHLDEVRPGLGALEYRTYLEVLQALPGEIPLLLEHLPGAEEYEQAAGYIRGVAESAGICL